MPKATPSAAKPARSRKASQTDAQAIVQIAPDQSPALLKALHILTRDGRLNQDSRRKLKQVNHLYQFIEPALKALTEKKPNWTLVDHGAGKSYLGFILTDRFVSRHAPQAQVVSIERREDLVESTRALARDCGFEAQMTFLVQDTQDALESTEIPEQIDITTALHACDTATDDAIRFGLKRQSEYIVVVPCCQAEVASLLRASKTPYSQDPLSELWRRPIHTREFGSHLTNTLRCLQLEAHGYQVTVTELVGWEHSLKNELILAQRKGPPQRQAIERLESLLDRIGLPDLKERFFAPKLKESRKNA